MSAPQEPPRPKPVSGIPQGQARNLASAFGGGLVVLSMSCNLATGLQEWFSTMGLAGPVLGWAGIAIIGGAGVSSYLSKKAAG